MLAPPFFNAEFADNDGLPLAGGLLYTYVSGTTTPLATYADADGNTENTNPIELDAAGRCNLWLAEDALYTLVLKRADSTTVKTFDNVGGVALASSAVTSVNSLTGDVSLTADDIPFTTGTATTWFSGADVTAALDAIIEQVDDLSSDLGGLAITAAEVSIADAGALITGTNVETALQEIAAKTLPSQSTHSGKFLTTNGTTASWAVASLPAFSASISGGNITESVGGGAATYGTRTVTATGGTSPYTYQWFVQPESVEYRAYCIGSSRGSSVTIGGEGDLVTVTGSLFCIVTDATGRVTTAGVTFSASHASAP